MEFGARTRSDWTEDQWDSGETYSHGQRAEIRVYEDFLEAQVWLENTYVRISGPSIVSSLVIPGYAVVKGMASKLSERTEAASAGCRLDLDFLSAVGYWGAFDLRAPLLSKTYKQLVKSRGYGEHLNFGVVLEISDGWRPYHISLSGQTLPVHRENEPYQFACWLARAVATQRMERSDLSQEDKDCLSEIAATEAEMSSSLDGSNYKRSMRVALPAHRPVSVALPGET